MDLVYLFRAICLTDRSVRLYQISTNRAVSSADSTKQIIGKSNSFLKNKRFLQVLKSFKKYFFNFLFWKQKLRFRVHRFYQPTELSPVIRENCAVIVVYTMRDFNEIINIIN